MERAVPDRRVGEHGKSFTTIWSGNLGMSPYHANPTQEGLVADRTLSHDALMTPSTRRSFLRSSLIGAAAGPAILSAADPNKKLAIACVGVGGKGWS
ncbi:MAG: hypothetical protein KDN18_08510, partial [Verrucomicrobiae bacterium]|nr:hypothetical protein [Verrucomicrobiae bacterium]